jgi:hypothetical protein
MRCLKQTPEPIFGIIKSVMGYRQSLLRGLQDVKGEWNLMNRPCAALDHPEVRRAEKHRELRVEDEVFHPCGVVDAGKIHGSGLVSSASATTTVQPDGKAI